MQYHLNGFRAGDPTISPAAREHSPELPDEVDVLIVGSGPAGLVLAAQLSAFPSIEVRIVDRNAGPLVLGKADGIACRTVEMFEAFGFAEKLVSEAHQVNETAFWRPHDEDRSKITRTGRIQDVADDLSECPHVILNQGRVHDHLLDHMLRSPSRIEPDYGHKMVDVVDSAEGEHPLKVTVELADGGQRSVRAKYVVGCDGAHSKVRKAIGRELHGDGANHAWGVMDILAVTDFPDIRLKAAIQSDGKGNILLIPREGGYLVRLYVDLGEVDPDNREAVRNQTSDEVIAAANRVLHPYALDVREIVWFSIYEVGQRVTDRFDEVSEEEAGVRVPRIFIAGDACHTHSAKAGQGLNVSMQDAFNLGWKLAAVLEGRSAPSLLSSYTAERQPVAQLLIDFDREWSAMIAAPPKDPANPEAGGVDPTEVQEYFVRQGRYTAGLATRYTPSSLTGEATYQHLASGMPIGERFHSAGVTRLFDAKPIELGHIHQADGRWRAYIFAGTDVAEMARLCDFLEHDQDSPVRRFTAAGADIDSIIDVRGVLQAYHRDVDVSALPSLLRPQKGRLGLVDCAKAFTAPVGSGNDIYDRRGIDRERGALVLVRPDQYIAHVLPLDAHGELAAFFSEIMIEP